nr:DUF1836 domain-containing protein [Maliibacterium massiliense]
MQEAWRKALGAWGQELAARKLPSWQALPEIDLYMDQIIALLERYLGVMPDAQGSKLISSSMVNNYVKLGVIPPPVKKRYTRTHIAYLLIICMLKQVLPISAIESLIALQLQTRSIADVYERFRTLQEQALAGILAQSEALGAQRALDQFALEMAIASNASKMMAEKLVALQRASLPHAGTKDAQQS